MTRSDNIFQSLKGRLVVSCQAEPPSPFDSPERVADFARCAVMGGAAGLTKSSFPDGTVCITGTMDDVDALVSLGVHVVAVDGTLRFREGALTGPEYIARIRKRHPDQLLMADISTLEEAVLCRAAGADCVSTTLAGYTPETLSEASEGPSLELLRECVRTLDCPVFAEGRYNTPAEAAEAVRNGAYAVVVGSAITRPQVVTSWFVKALEQ